MKSERQTKILSVIAILLAVGGLSIGFAALSQDLTIGGTADVKGSSWDVHFENLQNTATLGDAVVNTAPTIAASTTHIGDFDISLTSPLDSVTYTFDVVNDGTFEAKISSLVIPTPTCTGTALDPTQQTADATNVCDNITYTLTYADDTSLNVNDVLAANGGTVSMKLTLAYGDVTADLLPSADVNIDNLAITIGYAQN